MGSTIISWIPVTGTGIMTTISAVDAATYTVAFSGVSAGDEYTLSIGTGVVDTCSNPLAATVEISIIVSNDTWTSCSSFGTLSLGVTASPPYLPTGDTTNDGSGSCSTASGADIIATYMASSGGDLLFSWSNVNPTSFWTNYEIWLGNCDPAVGTPLYCSYSTGSAANFVYDANFGDIFYMKAIAYTAGDDFTSANFLVESFTPIAGEICSAAADISSASFPYTLTGSFTMDPAVGGSCDTTPFNASWFTYTPTATGWYQISGENQSASGGYPRIAIFETDACSPLGPEIECAAGAFGDATIGANPVILSAGTEYLIMFYTAYDTYPMLNPIINIQAISTPADGSLCATAFDLNTVTLPHQLTGVFDYDPAAGASCSTGAANAAWFTYTPPSSGWYDVIGVNHFATSSYPRIAVFETTACDPHGTELECTAGGPSVATIATGPVYLNTGTDYLIMFFTYSNSYPMEDPEIDIVTTGPPPDGESCSLPATTGSTNYYVGGSSEDCWAWTADMGNTAGDHVYSCDPGTGGDMVIEYTTGASQTTLNFDGSVANGYSASYFALQILTSPCTTGTSLYCMSTSGTLSQTGSVTVTPSTTYYIWVGEGFASQYLPDIDICLW